ncbi:transporter substrate-binding domain-containing protein [Olsenella sp. An290]|uniref:transporter substrate-binding domain-containing protein n=1 Tax=Olsenella sp. An290 TaxID=1965625 RepID=UPI000B3ABBDE|nr:transporter substrate-binding domain-containing protein [Olsenella sp. An290]OUO34403.1 ABC transporter substrate-binding protein [Olsenella sp. An290]
MDRRSFILSSLTAAALAATTLAGCGGAPAASDATEPAAEAGTGAAETGTLIVGFDSAYPPYGYVGDDGEYTGFDLELAQEVAARNDWEVQLEPVDWDAKDTLLDSGAINCIWNGFTMEGREGDYTFSEPYMLNAQVVVVRADSDIKGLDDLAGKAVITQVDSAAYNVLAGEDAAQAELAASFGSLETIGDYNTAFMQLESGAVDAVACDLSIAAYQLAAKPDAYVQIDEPLSEEHYAVGFKKGDDATAQKVTETLRAMDEDGFVQELCEKYADQGISYENWCLE